MPRDPNVDEWFAAKKHPQERTMQAVRSIILEEVRVGECIKWSTPTFTYEGNICSFNPAKHFVSLLFHRGAEIPGDHPLLEGEGKLARTARFTDTNDVAAKADALRAVIAAWCRSK